jgi:ubiquitin-conjugating enzyme E2 Q
MIFTRSVDVPKGVEGILQGIADSSAGMTVPELLGNISQKLHRYLATGSQNDPLSIDSDVDMPDGEEGQESEAESEDSYFPGSDDEFNIGGGHGGASVSATYSLNPQHAAKLNRRIKEDLRAVRFAGFKIGILIGMKADSVNSLLSLSIQAKKLGLSEEAMQAWDLEPQQYIVLLIRYSSGYKDFDAIINEPAKYHDVAFRIGVSNKYKPTIVEALAAFTDVSKNSGQSAGEDIEDAILEDKPTAGFSSMFISSSLNDFTNSQFISLLKIRNSVGIGWDGAKRYYNDKQGRLDIQTAELPSEYYEESNPLQSSLPDLVTADHLGDHQVKQISFPLIAAQFSLRYLTRCTEFCLVCHDKIKEDFEALKPYVCDKPLCLYQYMSLGFGPSVEHEILTQPYVVDLLVSFCYASAFVSLIK